jgi:hypothetical protein
MAYRGMTREVAALDCAKRTGGGLLPYVHQKIAARTSGLGSGRGHRRCPDFQHQIDALASDVAPYLDVLQTLTAEELQ